MNILLFLVCMLCSISQMAYSEIAWGGISTISTPSTNASEPRVVVDAGNNVTAIWIENNTIVSSSLPSGGSWSAPVTLSNPLNSASNPVVRIDSSGNVTALWIENSQVVSATLPSGGSWSGGVLISGVGAVHARLAVDGSGNAVAVWERSGFIESSTRISGSWSLVSILSTANSANPDIAISNSGTAIAVWKSLVSGADSIISATLTVNTNTWSATKNVIPLVTALSQNYPKAAIDANGNALVAWYRYIWNNGTVYQNVQVMGSTLSAGGAAWTIPQELSGLGMRNPADLTIKALYDANGNAFVVWTNSYNGEQFVIESVQKLVGGSWPQAVQPDVPSLYSFGIDLAGVSGTALLTNMVWDGISSIMIQSQESDTTDPVMQAWTGINPFSSGQDNGYPRCALSVAGSTLHAVAVWVNFDGANTVIHAATGTDSILAPPSNVAVIQAVTDFGVYKDYHNIISWDPSTSPDVIQYNIYRNGVYFTATDPLTFTLTDHNAVQGQAVTYGVAALNSAFRQSSITFYTVNP